MAIECPICKAPARLLAVHPEAMLYRCNSCTHAFSDINSMLKQENYEPNYYDDTHRRWFEHPNTALFDRIMAFIPLGASVVDVGCGRGDFLRYVNKKRPDARLTGIDYSRNEDKVIHFLQGDALEIEICDRFDVVVSLAVIEHVADCVAFTDRMRKLAKPGGTIAIMTVNESSILYGLARVGRMLGVPLAFDRLYSRHHLHHFTQTSLRKLVARSGLSVSKHLVHNAPLEALDLPVKSRVADALLRGIVMPAICGTGWVLSKSYLQTVIIAVRKDVSESGAHIPA